MTSKWIKRVIQVLFILIVLDALFLFYKYQEHKTSFSQEPRRFARILSIDSLRVRDKYERLDPTPSKQEVNAIIDGYRLKQTQQNISLNPGATKAVMFLKTHKTGSTTIQNIILRHAILNNLTIALPIYKASFFWPLKFSARYFVRTRDGITRYETLAHHAVLNKAEMKRAMVEDAKFITILRDPVSLFRSAYKYYHMERLCFFTPIEDITHSPNFAAVQSGLCPKTRMPVRNLQAYDLGLEPQDMDDEKAIKLLISELDSMMHLVMITERFDESLLLLKKRFNWSYEDIVYFKQNAQISQGNNSTATEQSEKTDETITKYNKADILIYEHFSKRLDKELKEEFTTRQLQIQLETLHQLQDDFYTQCVFTTAPAKSPYYLNKQHTMFHPYGSQTVGYVLKYKALNDIKCRLMALPELTLTKYLKGVHFGPKNTPVIKNR